MNLDTVLTKNPDAVYRVYDGKALIVMAPTGPEPAVNRVLNEVGSAIWERIDGRRTLREIRDLVVEEFEVTPQEAERDVLDFVVDLHRQSMVR